MDRAGATDEGLVRAIGPLGLTAAVVNVVVGGGIFVLPAAVAAEMGSAGVLAYVVCGGAFLFVAASFAIAGAGVSRTGGAYVYVEEAFGPFVGYLAGVLAWLSGALASAGLIAALAGIVAAGHPSLGGPGPLLGLVVLIYAGPVAVNLVAIRAGNRLIVATTAAKLAVLVLFLVIAAPAVDAARLSWTGPVPMEHLGRASILAFFSLAGMEAAVGASGEVRNPTRSVPLAMMTGMGLVILMYVAIHLVAQGVLGTRLAGSTAPLADAVGLAWPAGRVLMLAGMTFSMLGLLAGNLLGSSRVLFAFGRDRILHAAMARVGLRTHIPYVAVLTHAGIAVVLAATRTFATLAILASVTSAVLYGMVCAAALLLVPETGGRVPAVPAVVQRVVAVLGVVCMVWLAAQSTGAELGAVTVVLLLAGVLFALRRPRSPEGSGG